MEIPSGVEPQQARTGPRPRDRRGRGMRGPALMPDPAASPTTSSTTSPMSSPMPGPMPRPLPGPGPRSDRQRFDDLVLGIVTDVDARWSDRLGLVEYAVEEAPQIPDDWSPDTVPLSSLVRGSGSTPTRLVLFRRPIEHRCESRSDLRAMVLTVIVEQVAELLGIDADEVDPRYESGD